MKANELLRVSFWKILCAAVFFISMITAVPELIAVSRGQFGADEFGPGRIIREVLFLAMFGFTVLNLNRLPASYAQFFVIALLALVSYLVLLGLLRQDSLIAIVVVLRYLLILTIIYFFLAAYFKDVDQTDKYVASLIRVFVIICVPIAIWQVLYLPPVKGATFLGSRAFGLSPNPILFSQILAAFGLFFFVVKPPRTFAWLVVLFSLSLTTGGRSGVLALAGLLALHLIRQSRLDPVVTRLAYLLALLGAFLGYGLLSSEAVSGRVINSASIGSEARLDNWGTLISYYIHSGWQWLFGVNFGLGMNAYTGLTGRPLIDGYLYIPADNMFLSLLLNFGLVGLIPVVLALLAIGNMAKGINGLAILFTIALLGLTQNIVEIHVVNLIILAVLARTLVLSTKPAPAAGTGRQARLAQA
ncbi:hypothetical protein [Devosia chinhatensis]|uniref:Uncharacterized protein n=1 Tax=Devosia chinhatensis TaxID=429727 RepID=A0A0F5FLW2_9HYPH|nr:hypothetical protein [Devosia chinhatensis]KKB09803.1 hypothetical protein VE26_08095 [Devosia chinhatensis]